jgi:ribosomal RNA-processing protein 17
MSNIALLTKSHRAIASKKRARKEQVKEVVFDDDARRYANVGHTSHVLYREFFAGNTSPAFTRGTSRRRRRKSSGERRGRSRNGSRCVAR